MARPKIVPTADAETTTTHNEPETLTLDVLHANILANGKAFRDGTIGAAKAMHDTMSDLINASENGVLTVDQFVKVEWPAFWGNIDNDTRSDATRDQIKSRLTGVVKAGVKARSLGVSFADMVDDVKVERAAKVADKNAKTPRQLDLLIASTATAFNDANVKSALTPDQIKAVVLPPENASASPLDDYLGDLEKRLAKMLDTKAAEKAKITPPDAWFEKIRTLANTVQDFRRELKKPAAAADAGK